MPKQENILHLRRGQKGALPLISRFTDRATPATKRKKTEFAREMRDEKTPAERKLWSRIRRRGWGPWHPQRVMLGWIVDFWSYRMQMVIEVDGGYHDTPAQAEKDATRDRVMASHGILVVRIRNEEIEASLGDVLKRLSAIIQKRRQEIKRRPKSFTNQLIHKQPSPRTSSSPLWDGILNSSFR